MTEVSAKPMETGVRRGSGADTIARRLRWALLALSATTVLTGAIGLVAFHVARNAIQESNEVALPLAQQATGLLASVHGYQAALERLRRAGPGDNLASLGAELRERAAQIDVRLSVVAKVGGDSDRVDEMIAQARPLERLSTAGIHLTREDRKLAIGLMERFDVMNTLIRELSRGVEGLGLEAAEQLYAATQSVGAGLADGAAPAEMMARIQALTDQDVNRIQSIAFIESDVARLTFSAEVARREASLAALERRRGEFSLSLRGIVGRVPALADSEVRRRVSATLAELFELGVGQGNLFQLKQQRLRIATSLDDNAREVDQIGATLSDNARRLVEETRQLAGSATARATAAMDTGALLMLVVSIVAVVAAGLISSRYVLKRIVDPLNALVRVLEDLAAGKLETKVPPAPDPGMAPLAEALSVFRDNVQVVERQRGLLAEQAKVLAHSELRLRMAAAGAMSAVWERPDLTTDEVYWSPAFYSMLELDPAIDPSFAILRDLMHPQDRARQHDALARHLEDDTPYSVEFRLRVGDDRYRWFHATGLAGANPDSGARMMAGSLVDITARREAERALEEQARELRRSNTELEQFAAVASHDLQEPLRMVVSYCDLLRRRYSDSLDGEAREFLEFAVDGAMRMQHLIKSLLEYSRAGSRSIELRSISVDVAINAAIFELTALIEDKGATISVVGGPGVVNGDKDALARVFLNLIQNGLKFQGTDTPRIDIQMSCVDGRAVIVVTDNGIGVQPQYRERVFELFGRLHADSRFEGSGIGLPISRRIIERHGGTLRMDDDQPSSGSRFRIELPLAALVTADQSVAGARSHENDVPAPAADSISTSVP